MVKVEEAIVPLTNKSMKKKILAIYNILKKYHLKYLEEEEVSYAQGLKQ